MRDGLQAKVLEICGQLDQPYRQGGVSAQIVESTTERAREGVCLEPLCVDEGTYVEEDAHCAASSTRSGFCPLMCRVRNFLYSMPSDFKIFASGRSLLLDERGGDELDAFGELL